jgi:hypothetical protein
MSPAQRFVSTRRIVALIVAVMTAVATTARPAVADPVPGDRSLLMKYVGEPAHVVEWNGREYLVRIAGYTDSGLEVLEAATPRTIAWTDVRQVFVSGDPIHDGAGKGAAVGVGLGILSTQGSSCSDCPGQHLLMVAASMAFYGAIGAWIDHKSVGKTIIYRAPKQARR